MLFSDRVEDSVGSQQRTEQVTILRLYHLADMAEG